MLLIAVNIVLINNRATNRALKLRANIAKVEKRLLTVNRTNTLSVNIAAYSQLLTFNRIFDNGNETL